MHPSVPHLPRFAKVRCWPAYAGKASVDPAPPATTPLKATERWCRLPAPVTSGRTRP